MNKISVIIPAYNAARTIERTVRSVLASTIPLDVWVVDDGSTDDTAEIVDGIVGEKNKSGEMGSAGSTRPLCSGDDGCGSQLRVIKQRNMGVYSARLAALVRIATPYFGFVDADDTIDPMMFEKLLAFAESHDLEVAACDLAGAESRPPELFLTDYDMRRFVRSELVDGVGSSFVWNKLYRRRGIRFEPSSIFMFEDLALNLQLFQGVTRFGWLHEGLYHYDVNAGSSVRNFRRKNVDDLREVLRFRAKHLPKYGVAEDDPVHVRWLQKNARNMFIVACSAPCQDWKTRMDNVRYLLQTAGMPLPPCLGACVLVVGFAKRVQSALKSALAFRRWQ